jgi:hypothetical protein
LKLRGGGSALDHHSSRTLWSSTTARSAGSLPLKSAGMTLLRPGRQNLDHHGVEVLPLADCLRTQPLSLGPVKIEREHELDMVG